MSITARAKALGLECKEKLARAPLVLEALAKKHDWSFQKVGENMIRLGVKKAGWASQSAYINFEKQTGTFTWDSDFQRGLEPELRKIMNSERVLSDAYSVADIAIAHQQQYGCDWHWTGDESVWVDDEKIKASLAFS